MGRLGDDPSRVAVLGATRQSTLTWTAPSVGTVAHYRVYRTASAGGASGEEVLLADNVAATTYVDTGAQTAGTDKPLTLGATGPWVSLTASLAHARLDTAATIAPDPTGALHVYLLGGWGQCAVAPAAPMSCYEYASLSDDGATLGAFASGLTVMGSGRMRFGADAMTAANGPSGFADAGGASTAFVVAAGGKGISAQASTVEHAAVLAGGALGTWANPGGFSSEHDGTQLLIANGYGYALFGGGAPNYSQTVDQSAKATVTATTIAFANWNNAGANLGTKIGRHASVAESAYFYVIGGTTNDTDALATVYQVLH